MAQNVYFRFVPPAGEGVSLSQTLVEAHIDLSILEESTVVTQVDIRIELSDQSAPLCPCASCPALSQSRTWSTSVVRWTLDPWGGHVNEQLGADDMDNTPDLLPLFQELQASVPGWTTDSPMTFEFANVQGSRRFVQKC